MVFKEEIPGGTNTARFRYRDCDRGRILTGIFPILLRSRLR